MLQSPFIVGKIYKRTSIQDQYGGSRQSGIAPCASYPYIFIFSGDAGHQHGYKDQWENENVFSYTGEGQVNDMTFIRGNLALKDHIKNGKRVFLFFYVAKGIVRYEAELQLLSIDYFQGQDREGKERTAIKFFFKRIGKHLNYPIEQLSFQLVADPEEAYKNDIPNETERKGLVTSRVGQGAYRKSILFRWDFKCAVTNYAKNEILIASHIVPWKGSSNDERLDVNNGILLSPTYDALFDKHLISFENTGKIILSDPLLKSNYKEIGISGKEVIKKLSINNYPYLEKHRELLL
ncbi:MAG: HNH endonuclease [Bacteroidota bacterium]|nr:HNH endonuclease [Bacteroidota bacterium]